MDRLVRNPADLADPPPARRGDAPTMKTWTAPELRRFLAHVEGDRLYGAWVVAATTGMRRGEVLALRWRDVDLTLGRLSISQQVTTLGNRPVVSSPKTAKSRRLVALDPATVEALRLHRVAQAEERLLMGPAYRDEDLVFAWPDGRPIHPDLFSQWFDRHARPPDCRASACTIMRHTHATLALAAGIHPKIVSERLGHSTISITLDTYSHVSPGLQEEAAARVADLVFASATSWTWSRKLAPGRNGRRRSSSFPGGPAAASSRSACLSPATKAVIPSGPANSSIKRWLPPGSMAWPTSRGEPPLSSNEHHLPVVRTREP